MLDVFWGLLHYGLPVVFHGNIFQSSGKKNSFAVYTNLKFNLQHTLYVFTGICNFLKVFWCNWSLCSIFWKLSVQLHSLWCCLRRTVKYKGSIGTPNSFTLCKGVKSLLLKSWNPGGGNGYPFQYSCLENFMDRGAWWATIHGVMNIRTWPSD